MLHLRSSVSALLVLGLMATPLFAGAVGPSAKDAPITYTNHKATVGDEKYPVICNVGSEAYIYAMVVHSAAGVKDDPWLWWFNYNYTMMPPWIDQKWGLDRVPAVSLTASASRQLAVACATGGRRSWAVRDYPAIGSSLDDGFISNKWVSNFPVSAAAAPHPKQSFPYFGDEATKWAAWAAVDTALPASVDIMFDYYAVGFTADPSNTPTDGYGHIGRNNEQGRPVVALDSLAFESQEAVAPDNWDILYGKMIRTLNTPPPPNPQFWTYSWSQIPLYRDAMGNVITEAREQRYPHMVADEAHGAILIAYQTTDVNGKHWAAYKLDDASNCALDHGNYICPTEWVVSGAACTQTFRPRVAKIITNMGLSPKYAVLYRGEGCTHNLPGGGTEVVPNGLYTRVIKLTGAPDADDYLVAKLSVAGGAGNDDPYTETLGGNTLGLPARYDMYEDKIAYTNYTDNVTTFDLYVVDLNEGAFP